MLSHVYLEQQVSALCGRHAVNNLLQGPYVNEIDLAQIAQELDEIEQNLMLQDRGIGGEPTANALRFVANFESSNVDDSGNFSVTVLKEALNRWGKVDLTTEKELVEKALSNPTDSSVEAFLLNHDAHWLSIRRLKIAGGSSTGTWLNLNSTLKAPEVITDFYLREWLFQLRADGYTVFFVTGKLPAPIIGRSARDAPNSWHESLNIINGIGVSYATRKSAESAAKTLAANDPEYRRALEMSIAESGGGGGGGGGGSRTQKRNASMISSSINEYEDEDDIALQQVLAASMSGYTNSHNIDEEEDKDLTEALALSLGSETPLEIVARLSLSLPAEPVESTSECVRIAIRLPPSSPFGGSSVLPPGAKSSYSRRFAATCLMTDVFNFALLSWIEAFLPVLNGSKILTTPSREFSLNSSALTGPAASYKKETSVETLTLKSAGLSSSAALVLRPLS